MKPKQLKIENKIFQIIWDDIKIWNIPIDYLRDECPCAGCKGETILLHTYRPAVVTDKKPEMYIATGIKTVGGYAIQISWKDGHDTGLYSWEYLEQLSKDSENKKPQDYSTLA